MAFGKTLPGIDTAVPMFRDLFGRELKSGDRILFSGLYKRRRFHATLKVSNVLIAGDTMYAGQTDEAGAFRKNGWFWNSDGKRCYQVIKLS